MKARVGRGARVSSDSARVQAVRRDRVRTREAIRASAEARMNSVAISSDQSLES
jgi:hypothetical protein